MPLGAFFVIRLLTDCIRAKKVLVLIPPPVDPGEAPININIVKVKRALKLSDRISGEACRPCRNALKESPQPCYFFGGLQQQRADQKQRRRRG